ncbi:MAG: LysR family transcriptional regulator, partial [Pseudomonadales bacterium]
DQKVEAILAGIGIGNLPRERIQGQLDSGELIPLALPEDPTLETFLVWKISNRGKGLKDLTQRLSAVFAQ